MNKKDKELLIKDLGARLLYGVMIKTPDRVGTLREIDVLYDNGFLIILSDDGNWLEKIVKCKPYLRPMSSMTDDERTEIKNIISRETDEFVKFVTHGHGLNYDGLHMFWKEDELDWLNAHHFDHRRLIEKGLAIEAPNGMYNIK